MITKNGMFAIAGRPNVGKSTLTNALAGEKVAIVSDKPQTTRNRITAIRDRGECQFIFLDTPGFHKPVTKLGEYMNNIVSESVADVDAVLLVVEPEAYVGKPETMLIEKLKEQRMPAILVINKIDTVMPERLLEVIAAYRDAYDFSDFLPVSAKNEEGIDELLDALEKFAAEGPPLFPEGQSTDQPERQIVAEIIREKLLLTLEKEVPHGVAVAIEGFEEEEGVVRIGATIYCERDSHKGIIIGKNGSKLKQVGTLARADLEKFFGTKVFLETWVKVKENWRQSEAQIRNFGFN
jgi:GTP-binding protein Era